MPKQIVTIFFLLLTISSVNIHANEVIDTAANKAIEAGFTELERQLIINYIDSDVPQPQPSRSGMVFNNATLKKKQEKTLPPGLAKKQELPPGLAAQLQRNGTLPPGLEKRSLPARLEQQLPPVREGHERSMLDDLTVVLVETATKRIVDIIFDVATENTANGQK